MNTFDLHLSVSLFLSLSLSFSLCFSLYIFMDMYGLSLWDCYWIAYCCWLSRKASQGNTLSLTSLLPAQQPEPSQPHRWSETWQSTAVGYELPGPPPAWGNSFAVPPPPQHAPKLFAETPTLLLANALEAEWPFII